METTEIKPDPTRRRFSLAALLVTALAAASLAGGGAWLLSSKGVTGQPEQIGERWQCPMHPTIIRDHPGSCPICGMTLVKMDDVAPAADAQAGRSEVEGLATVDIDPARQQLIGLATAEVTTGTVGGQWRTSGRVAVDETRVRHINVKVSGFVDRIYVDYVGKAVRKGEPLFSIYSPDLLSAQEEYQLARRTRTALAEAGGLPGADGDALVASAKRKLQLWDVPEAEIDRLEAGGLPTRTLTLNSPISGVVTSKDVVEGMKLDAGAMPYELVDLSVVWVLADVYETELAHVELGMPARLTLAAYPNEVFEGHVSFVAPMLDPATRTVTVRLEFPNPTGELKPAMFGEVVLQGKARQALRIPADAVLDSGTRKVVFVALDGGRFQPREVRIGDSDGTNVEVVEGLQLGERVVVRANFLVDSESRLRASLAAMGSAPAEPMPGMSPSAGSARDPTCCGTGR